MSEEVVGNALVDLREVGLGPGLLLAEQRCNASQRSPGSRFGGIGALLKRVVRRSLRFHLLRQAEFNTGTVRALREAEAQLRGLANPLEELTESVRVLREIERAREVGIGERIDVLERDARERRLSAVQEQAEASTGLQLAERRISQLEERIERLSDRLGGEIDRIDQNLEPTLSLDYLEFERRFRGDERVIASHMQRYVGLFGSAQRVLDFGCGRGEFLQVCRKGEVGAYGVDVNPDMVSVCLVKGLDVHQEDGLDHLGRLEDRSLDGIFSSQVIEHLPPHQLLRMLELASRKIRRGGLLVLETLNPDTFVALHNFHMDPTHRQAIPCDALRFFVEAAGLSVREVIRSSPVPDDAKLEIWKPNSETDPSTETLVDLYNRNTARLNDTLFSDRDYALVAQR